MEQVGLWENEFCRNQRISEIPLNIKKTFYSILDNASWNNSAEYGIKQVYCILKDSVAGCMHSCNNAQLL